MKKPKRNPDVSRMRNLDDTRLKAVKAENGLFTELTGYATKWDVVDSYGEVVDRGAFTKSIIERMPKGMIYLLYDHGWEVENLIGTIVEAKEDDYGLWFRATISSNDNAQAVMWLIEEGHAKFLSIGYNPVKELYVEPEQVVHLVEIKWREVSVVLFPANEGAIIVGAKSAVIPFQDHPLTSLSREWVKPEEFKREACLFDGFPIAEVVDGGLMVNPNAVKLAIEHLLSPDCILSEDDRSEAMDVAIRYYAKAGFPPATLQPVEHKQVKPDDVKPEDAPLPDVTVDREKTAARIAAIKHQYKL
jgi:HK97 family phage prohead protease